MQWIYSIISVLGNIRSFCIFTPQEEGNYYKREFPLDKIYITGGFNGQECMNSVEVYDPDVNQWTTLAAMRSRRSGVSCISYHNKVSRYIASCFFLLLLSLVFLYERALRILE